MVSDLYALLVVEGNISPEYFLDKMQMYELPVMLTHFYKRKKEEWEQTRLLAYVVAQSNSTKKLKMTDIMSFSWDNEIEKDTSISKEEIARLKDKAKQFINKQT